MHPAILIAALTITVTGGDSADREKVKESYERVPECLRAPFEKGEGDLRIMAGSLNAAYFPAYQQEVERILSGKAASDAGPGSRHYIGVADRLLVDAERRADEALAAPQLCTRADRLEPLFRNLDRILLHEVAHSYHLGSPEGRPDPEIEKFLNLRWRGLYKKWSEDPVRKRTHEKYRAAQDRVALALSSGKKPSKELLQEVCDLQEALAKKYGRMPSRHPGDFHAFDNEGGAEYFAMAIETLVYAPEVFCKTYTREEIAWLKDYLGKCLANLKKRAPCYEAMPSATVGPARETRTPAGAGKWRD